ncbi:ribonuclease R [Helicobacter sp. MIT 21-1697]|uniref:RNB domain-containing ribonuclease n=1 Tax=Helicobacter sp. MIT 21-1697 TaxID=2993733 RepID=UPI00224A4C71|nr:ribonuclease R family protein [Helicobacter sp. MIT 21-1697]MCX2716322.1 ribonuclease R [Helicobacter sp. MIT 21-1697]
MVYFYALIAAGVRKNRIPKSFAHALKHLEELNVLDIQGEYYTLKNDLIIGSVDISRSGKVFLKSFKAQEHNDFVLERGRVNLKKGDIILAKHARSKARFITLLYSSKTYALAALVMKKGFIKAIDISQKNDTQSYIELKVSQKSLRALPPHCVVKVELSSGNIIEVFGVLEDAHIDEKIALSLYNRSSAFSPQAQALGLAFGDEVYKDMYPNRVDLSDLPFCVIDPQDARDHDDAIYFESKTKTLYVAIADVSEYVGSESEIDKEARQRGFSIYFPHKVVPMLPFELSNGICSLKENALRLAMVWKIELNKNAQVVKSELLEAFIKPQANVSYEVIESFLQGHKSTLPKEIQKWLKAYLPYIKKCKAHRLRNGYEFESQEIKLELDEYQQIHSWHKYEHTLAHSIIEESMLLANVQSAQMLLNNTQKGIFRIHPPPKEERIKELEWEVKNMGFTLPPTRTFHHLIYHIQAQAKGKEIAKVIDEMIIKSFAKATYSVENKGHFGLGFESYTHFTSPIRRYSDLIVHRILKAVLHKDKSLPFLLEGLNGIAQELNIKQKQISHIEQDFYQRKMLRYAQKLLESPQPLICTALVIDEDSHALALDVIPHIKITLWHSLEKFKLIKVKIQKVDLLCGCTQGEIIESTEITTH